jgi:hypothetical protein
MGVADTASTNAYAAAASCNAKFSGSPPPPPEQDDKHVERIRKTNTRTTFFLISLDLNFFLKNIIKLKVQCQLAKKTIIEMFLSPVVLLASKCSSKRFLNLKKLPR